MSFFPQGIGQGRVTANLQGAPIDDAVFVDDREAVDMVRMIETQEGTVKLKYFIIILLVIPYIFFIIF